MRIVCFTKSFQDLSIPEVCRTFREIGLDGLDLTVRPGGHIEPANVRAELPRAVRAAEEAGVQIPQLTTGITEPDANAEALLATAGELGIGRIKLGYYRYRPLGTLREQLDAVRRQLAAVSKLAAKHQVRPCVHIHSGTFLPSHGTQLYLLLKDFDPAELGAYVDPLHMTLEGGSDGWRQGLDLLAPWIALCSLKNFSWERSHRDPNGQQRWKTAVCPLADGVCPLPDFLAALKELGYRDLFSLHSEYKGGHSFKDLDTDGCIAQTKADLEFVRQFLGKSQA